MEPDRRSWTPSSIVLVMAGVTLGTGLYFLLLRPPLLPEDIRYMALPPALALLWPVSLVLFWVEKPDRVRS